MAAESFDINDWLFRRLRDDPAVAAEVECRIFPDEAPLGTAPRYILYSQQSGVDTNSLGLSRVVTRLVYFVRAVDRADVYSPLRTAVTALDRALHGAVADLASCRITVSRIADRQFPELKDNVRYMTKGGLYAVTAQPFDDQH